MSCKRKLFRNLKYINSSRTTTYGCDQRMEAFASRGTVRSNNLRPTAVTRHGPESTALKDLLLFVAQYSEAKHHRCHCQAKPI